MEEALPCLITPEGAEEVEAVDHQPREPAAAAAALPWKSSLAEEAAAEVAGLQPWEPVAAVAAALPWKSSQAAAAAAEAAGLQPSEPEEEVAALPWKSFPAAVVEEAAGVHPPHEAEAGVPPSAAAPVEAGEAAAGDQHQREASHSNAARR